MKTILLPTDFSPVAQNAINYAAHFSHHYDAELMLLHACHIPVYSTHVPMILEAEEQLLDVSNRNLRQIKAKLESAQQMIKVQCVSNFGLAAENIINTAREKHADLIIMGTKGASGLMETILGSNAAAVLESAACPVLVVPAGINFKAIKKIIFATDYNDSDFKSLAFISEIASLFKAEILIVHVSSSVHSEGYEQDLLGWYQGELKKRSDITYNNISFQLLEGTNVYDSLNDFIEKSNADLVAMTTRSRSFMSKMLERSLTKKMAYHTKVPLLSFHE